MRSFAVILLVTVLVLGQAIAANPNAAAASTGQNLQSISQQLRHYDLLELDAANVAEQVRQTGQLSIATPDGPFDLALLPYDIRSLNYRSEEPIINGAVRSSERPPAFTYKGTVRGVDGAQARFTIDGKIVEGLIITPAQKYFIEPASRYSSSVSPNGYVVYRESDVIQDYIGSCPFTLSAEVHSEVGRVSKSPSVLSSQFSGLTPAVLSPPLEAEVATEADNEFVQALGSTQAANNEILSILNMVDGVYQSEIGLSLKVVFQRAWDPATPDPYSGTTDVQTLLTELRTQWNINPPAGAPTRDLVHMWTGKTMNVPGFASGGRTGFTNDGVVCRDAQFGESAAYGLSQRFINAVAKVVIPAHEIGHNFGATHPDQENPAHPECSTTIMNSDATNSSLTFCQFSRDQITNYINGSADGVTPNNACLSVVTTPPPTVQFTGSNYSATEGTDKSVLITITRSSGNGASTVSYETVNQSASERSDYTTARGTLAFAAGETTKTFTVFITDDVFAETAETFGVLLSNPTGATLAAPSSATVTIADNDAVNGANPVKDASFNPGFFVRQHYIDFLNREADPSGLAFWVNQLTECDSLPAAEQQPCREARRINVSASFFLSIEFQETGFYVIRIQRVAFGHKSDTAAARVTYNQFIKDAGQVGNGVIVGQPGADAILEQNKQTYAQQIVDSTDFATRFPASQDAATYVNALYSSAGVTPTATERQDAITAFGAGGTAGRVAALRKVADSASVRQAEVNQAFVLMQYFGYLRRNPTDAPDTNDGGYQFWLGKLIEFGGNFVNAEMVKAFITSVEYQQRFGP